MRVIAGSLKGRRLAGPTWVGLRPTSDKLRETLFNVLGPRIVGARVADLYAGTGALGIEALSRGAAHVTFVEQDTRAHALIRRNLEACGIVNGYVIIRDTVARALDTLRHELPFDIVLLDPPYGDERGRRSTSEPNDALEGVDAITRSGGLVVLEHPRRRQPPRVTGSLALVRVIESGDSALGVYSCQH
jgi:16S rRNA (guanine(966)-N(2))-methyltransferase RsmD